MKKRKSKYLFRKYKYIICTVIVLIICIFFLKGRNEKIKNSLDLKTIEESRLLEQYEEIKNKTNQLKGLTKENLTDDEYEKLARAKLGLIKENEIIIKPK